MCRWLAYRGPAIPLATLLTRPEHSLLDQSEHARLNLIQGRQLTTNGDGFGVAWYGTGEGPGLYRDPRPAWGNENVSSIAEHVSSPLFMAHVRAASAGRAQVTNCHPFRNGPWVFQHNGHVGGWEVVRRSLQMALEPELYAQLAGTTDSETVFLTIVGLLESKGAEEALRRMVRLVEKAQRKHGLEPDFRFTCCLSDGEALWALRVSSSNYEPPSLFVSRDVKAIRGLNDCYTDFPRGGRLLVSEPLDRLRSHWQEVPAQSIVHIDDDGTSVTELNIR